MSGRGMVKGAVKTSELLFHGSEYAKQHIAPEGVRVVDPKVEKYAEYYQQLQNIPLFARSRLVWRLPAG